MPELKLCPVCGSKPIIRHDVVDGFYLGYSIGCPRFKADDGIHGWAFDDPEDKKLTIFHCNSRKDAIDKWERRVAQCQN